MKTVSTIAEIMDQYGPMTTILIVFLFLLIVIFKIFISNYNKSIKKMIEDNEIYSRNILKQNENLMNKLLDLEETSIKNYKEEDIVEIFVKLNKTLKQECIDTLNIIGADRVSIYVFHNGTIASHGLPFFKMSCVCEAIKKGSGIVSKINDHNSIPLSLFDGFIDYLYDEGIYVISTSPDNNISMPSQPNINELIEKHTFSMTIPVYDTEYRIMGFVIEEHGSTINGDEQLIEIRSELYRLTEKISPVLAFSNYNKLGKKE